MFAVVHKVYNPGDLNATFISISFLEGALYRLYSPKINICWWLHITGDPYSILSMFDLMDLQFEKEVKHIKQRSLINKALPTS